jgi:hypothetical protein
MPNVLTYTVTAGPVTDADVVKRTLQIVVNGESKDSTNYPSDATKFSDLVVNQDDSVVMTLIDTDDAGNPSAPAVVEFVALDTIPPAMPGSFGVTLVSET